MRSDSVKNMSAYADQNHAPSLAATRLEWANLTKMTSKKSLKEGDYFYTTIDNTTFIKYNNTNIFFKGDDKTISAVQQ